MFVSPVNTNNYNLITHKNLPDYRIFVQKPDEVSIHRDKIAPVSFCAMTKAGFWGNNLLVVNKFSAPIQKFKEENDLQIWCAGKVKQIMGKDYTARNFYATNQRKSILKEWFDYVPNKYTKAEALLILDGITKELRPNEDNLPHSLNITYVLLGYK